MHNHCGAYRYDRQHRRVCALRRSLHYRNRLRHRRRSRPSGRTECFRWILPNGLIILSAAVTTTNTVTVQLCATASVTPVAKTYNVTTQ